MVAEAHRLTGLDFRVDLLLVLLKKSIHLNVLPFFPCVTLRGRDVPAGPESPTSVGRRTLITPMCALPRVNVRCVNGPGVLVLHRTHLLLHLRLQGHAVADHALEPILVLLHNYLGIGQRLLLFQGARVLLLFVDCREDILLLGFGASPDLWRH